MTAPKPWVEGDGDIVADLRRLTLQIESGTGMFIPDVKELAFTAGHTDFEAGVTFLNPYNRGTEAARFYECGWRLGEWQARPKFEDRIKNASLTHGATEVRIHFEQGGAALQLNRDMTLEEVIYKLKELTFVLEKVQQEGWPEDE